MIEQSFLFLIIVGVVIVGLIGWIVWLEIRMSRLFKGTDGQSLEARINEALAAFQFLQAEFHHARQHRDSLQAAIQRSHKAVAVKRFNAFDDAGGNNSFALAILDDHGDGFVLSSLYSHGKTNVFAKEVSAGRSELMLTAEELFVLDSARKNEYK